jgi:hypothetical protein
MMMKHPIALFLLTPAPSRDRDVLPRDAGRASRRWFRGRAKRAE